jgi:hypothetical protein
MSLNIWIPPQYREPNGHCNVCDEDLFGTVGDMQKHMAACARQNIDAIRAAAPSAKNKGGPFDPETWDPEAEAHMREVGKRMLREGRLETLPSERIVNG